MGSCMLCEFFHPTICHYFKEASQIRGVCSMQILSVRLNQGDWNKEVVIARDLTPCQAKKAKSLVREQISKH